MCTHQGASQERNAAGLFLLSPSSLCLSVTGDRLGLCARDKRGKGSKGRNRAGEAVMHSRHTTDTEQGTGHGSHGRWPVEAPRWRQMWRQVEPAGPQHSRGRELDKVSQRQRETEAPRNEEDMTGTCSLPERRPREKRGGRPAERLFVSRALVNIICRRSQLPVRKTKAK